MSRLNRLSPSAIKAMFSSETEEQLITLITIEDPHSPNTPIRLANGFTQRLAQYTTDDELVYGVVSRTHDFLFLPLEINLPIDEEAGLGDVTLSLNYVTAEAIELIRTYLTSPSAVTIELVIGSTPDYVEAVFSGFSITNVTYNAQSIVMTLTMTNYNREPFPAYTFTPKYFPGLF